MTFKLWQTVGLCCAVLTLAGCRDEQQLVTLDESPVVTQEPKPAIICRLFFQDHDTKELRWTDVLHGETPRLDKIRQIAGFPELDAARQNLVQMEECRGTVLVGVRDDADGTFQSGWLLLSTGVEEESHGDHGHWHYGDEPRILARQLDDQQGNPAHLYVYQDVYYLANDRKDGYTRINPAGIGSDDAPNGASGFHAGGGHHITLAIADGQTGYGTWIDGGGPNQGRVDVTRIKPDGNEEISYSFSLPSGAIHGAAYAANKVFFAPADGICWIEADLTPTQDHAPPEIHHISLGKNSETEKPLRTGAFATHRDYVAFVYGQDDFAALGLVNAQDTSPDLISVPLPMQTGHSPTVPTIVKTAAGQRLVFVFHNHDTDDDGEEFLSIVELDPNGDLEFSDAKLLETTPVGQSAVEGHYGHHEVAFDDGGRFAFWTNPGDGTISVMSLDDLSRIATIPVGGKPTKLIAIGEEDHGH